MESAVINARYAASEEFLKVIFADPDLFEDAFAAVTASWDASPPRGPVSSRTGARPPDRWPPRTARSTRSAARGSDRPRDGAWQLHMARSPPVRGRDLGFQARDQQ
jgi:hypothetical protein